MINLCDGSWWEFPITQIGSVDKKKYKESVHSIKLSNSKLGLIKNSLLRDSREP